MLGAQPPRSQPSRRSDRGFTLVELLIVIVILGVLATVTVFAVRGITDKGKDNSEGIDLRTLETATEAYYVDNQTNPADQAALVAGGYLTEESTMHSMAVAGDGSLEFTNVRTGAIVGTAPAPGAGGGGGGGGSSVPAPTATAGTPVTIGGVPMLRYGPSAASRPYYIIGGATAGAQWDAAVNANTTINGSYTFFFIDVANVPNVAGAVAVRNAVAGNWGFLLSQADDVANFDGTSNSLYYAIENANGVPISWNRINPGSINGVAGALAQP